jgi:rhamnosyltransferase
LLYFGVGVLKDLKAALLKGHLFRNAASILSFRSAQYWGVYRGNRRARYVSRELKLRYFYPRVRDMSLEKD